MVLRLLRSVFSRVRGYWTKGYYSSPAAYWESRHRKHGASLVGVGNICLREEQNQEDYEAKWRHVEPVVQGVRPPGRPTLLDAGCGTGWFTAKFRALGFEVSGADFSPKAVEIARARVGDDVAWYVGPLDQLPAQRRYDVVACIDVLFHIVDDGLWARTVHHLASLVAPAGSLIIQDHLVTEADVVQNQPLAGSHCRWRSLERYRAALGQGWGLHQRQTYQLPREKVHEDLLVFRRAAR